MLARRSPFGRTRSADACSRGTSPSRIPRMGRPVDKAIGAAMSSAAPRSTMSVPWTSVSSCTARTWIGATGCGSAAGRSTRPGGYHGARLRAPQPPDAGPPVGRGAPPLGEYLQAVRDPPESADRPGAQQGPSRYRPTPSTRRVEAEHARAARIAFPWQIPSVLRHSSPSSSPH